MNKLILSALVSASFSSAALAASLDVHGEIKVNGTTVINEQGQLVAQQPDAESFSVTEYLDATGVILHQENLWYWDDNNAELNTDKLIITKGMDGSYSYDVVDADGQVVWKYQETPTDEGYSYANGQNLDSCTGSVKINKTMPLPGALKLGSAYGELSEEVETSSCSWNDNEPYEHTNNNRFIYTVLGTTSYQLAESTLEDCVLVKEHAFNSSYQTSDNVDFSINEYSGLLTACKGVGVVDIVYDGGQTKTTHVEMLSEPASRSAAVTGARVNYRKMAEARHKAQ